MNKALALGTSASLLLLWPSAALAAQQVDCAPVYEGQKAEVGASVQLEDGSWVEVTDSNMCMGESIQGAAANAAAAAGSASGVEATSGSTAASGLGSTTTGTTTSAGAPQGAVNTGLGGLATGVSALALLGGGALAAGLGALAGRRRA